MIRVILTWWHGGRNEVDVEDGKEVEVDLAENGTSTVQVRPLAGGGDQTAATPSGTSDRPRMPGGPRQ